MDFTSIGTFLTIELLFKKSPTYFQLACGFFLVGGQLINKLIEILWGFQDLTITFVFRQNTN